MPWKSAYGSIARATSFLWGFAFLHLFKYILEKIYPFWSQSASLSLFAYCLIFIAWLSYILFFNFNPNKNKIPRLIYHLAFFINALVFLFIVLKIGESNYLFLYPLFFTFQFLIYFFLFTSIFPSLLQFRVSLLLGILSGLLSYPYIANIYIDIFLPAAIYLMPHHLILKANLPLSKSRQRMLPLRQSIDFLRYLMLGVALYGAFDKYRSQFYVIIFILSIGPLLAHLLLWADKKKHHIKYGMFALALFFAVFVELYRSLPVNYFAAIGFSFLTIWEALYFKKVVEGDMRREQILSGMALVISTFYYIISDEWINIITGIFFILIQIRMILYIARSYRKTMSMAFVVSLIIWIAVLVFSYNASFKRNFFVSNKSSEIERPSSLTLLNIINDPDSAYAMNLFPAEVVEKFNQKRAVKIYSQQVQSPFFLQKINALSKRFKKITQIYSLKKLKPYSEKTRQSYIFSYTRSHKIRNVFIFDETKPGEYFNNSTIYPISGQLNFNVLNKDDFYDFGLIYAEWYSGKRQYEYSLTVLKEMMNWFDSAELYRQIASTYGILGNAAGQIEFRQKIMNLGLANAEDKNILLELYFLSGEIDMADQICEDLIFSDFENVWTYLEWKYKIIKKRKNRYQLEALYNRIIYQVSTPPEKITRKNNLAQKIEDDLKSSPQYNDLFKTEKKRQENILYPE